MRRTHWVELELRDGSPWWVGGRGAGSHLNSLVVEEGIDSCVARFIVCFVHFYPETSPVCKWRHKQ